MKKSIALLYGGKSPEHEVSVVSARNVYAAIDLDVYNPILIAISPDGDWYLDDDQQLLDETVSMVTPGDGHHPLTISPNQ